MSGGRGKKKKRETTSQSMGGMKKGSMAILKILMGCPGRKNIEKGPGVLGSIGGEKKGESKGGGKKKCVKKVSRIDRISSLRSKGESRRRVGRRRGVKEY